MAMCLDAEQHLCDSLCVCRPFSHTFASRCMQPLARVRSAWPACRTAPKGVASHVQPPPLCAPCPFHGCRPTPTPVFPATFRCMPPM
eukprot:67919-Chlamydomonas_euryale.AAC.1